MAKQIFVNFPVKDLKKIVKGMIWKATTSVLRSKLP